uniref:Tyrosine--tRNA ligase n=1 Tax=Paramoeba aestuarina TaxID=180227 RepID=A0A7S4L6L2_9EUKA|eukprot:CAMPEP_0201510544 /NCGR_PEP_ID=MMETSP0161_2-20130828/3188_1 /ASSEMBLY_ACC=CAM_ASM_000251 /TAXON_ID=180227 /ORGANISM="Neoparamoeba aestuarina, Strain SoJaBio B1-5/56/2" /LENGTH=587 /DNA_ID=CAMNT_0047905733 /DNA_START=80 /DNA_END=1843 /DNA_ORIENTATION=-
MAEEKSAEGVKLADEEMQKKNQELPSGEMSPEVKARWDLMTKQLHSWVDPNQIKAVLEKGEPKIYWGTATTGKPHLGYFVPIYKISDFLAAGCHVTILFANLHGFLDNMKSSWELLELRMQFYEVMIKGMLTYIGVPIEKLRFERGTNYQLSEKYTLDMYRMAAAVTTEHTTKAGAEVVKQVGNPLMSNLLYPILQALDEEYLGVDIQFGGLDQRKIFMFAREKLPLIGYKKRAYLMNPLIPGLGKSGKMSSSEPLSKIDFDDTEQEVTHKIKNAFSVDGVVQGNGLLAITKYILFRKIEQEKREFVVPRPEKFGGEMRFKTYEEVEAAFAIQDEEDPKKLFSSDFKKAVLAEIKPLLTAMRKVVEENQDLHDRAYPDHVKQAKGGKGQKGKQQQQKGKGGGAKGGAKGGAAPSGPPCPSRVDFKVGLVESVENHPSSDTLYIEKINIGGDAPVQIVSGLAKHISIEDFTGRKVIVFANLKPSNFRGARSEGMVMCTSKDEKVEILTVPASAKPGDRVKFGNKEPQPDAVIDPKKPANIWNGKKAEPAPLNQDMIVDDNGCGRWKEEPMTVGGEPVTAETLRNTPIS